MSTNGSMGRAFVLSALVVGMFGRWAAGAAEPAGADGKTGAGGQGQTLPPEKAEGIGTRTPGHIPEPFTVVVGNGRYCPVVVTTNGTLVMVKGIGRIGADGLQQNIGAVRSTDGGRTWGQENPITKDGNWFDTKADPKIDYTYPQVLLDRDTGIIWLLHNVRMQKGKMAEKDGRGRSQWTERRWYAVVRCSKDDGLTWSEPVYEFTKAAGGRPAVGSVTTGTQLGSGRLLFSGQAYMSDTADVTQACCLYSDDHGKTWQPGHPVPRGRGMPAMGNSTIVELLDGRLLFLMRPRGSAKLRTKAYSCDGGNTWSASEKASTPNPDCVSATAGFVRLSDEKRHDRNRLLYSGAPAGDKSRGNLYIWISYDEGETWQMLKNITKGSSYSHLAVLPDMSIGCSYDGGPKGAVGLSEDEKKKAKGGWSCCFARFTLEWLTDGKDKVDVSKFTKK